jgi:hypothetical protein
MTRRFGLLLLLTMLLPACASMRKINVGSDTSTNYSVDVHNSHSATLTVSYTDSRGSHELGTVAGGRTERFVIAGATSGTVSIRGTTSGGTSYTKSVSLSAGVTSAVTL